MAESEIQYTNPGKYEMHNNNRVTPKVSPYGVINNSSRIQPGSEITL